MLCTVNIRSCFLLYISLWETYGYEKTTGPIDAGRGIVGTDR